MIHRSEPVGDGFPPPSYASLDLEFRLRCTDDDLARRLADLYSACESGGTRRDTTPMLDIDVHRDIDRYELRVGDDVLCRASDPDEVLEWCAWRVNSMAIERSATADLVLHAAAAARGGKALILAGPSGAGKSTLVTALTLSGLAYMGDDGVAVDAASGRLRSNPKPIALDDAARDVLMAYEPANDELRRARRLLAPRAIGAAVDVGGEVTPCVIVRPVYRPGAAVAMSPMTAAEAAELLADESFNFAALGPAALRTVAAVARRARAFVLDYDDLGGAVEAIERALAGEAKVPSPGGEEPPERRRGLDVEVVDGEALVWDGERRALHRLSATATAIWNASEQSTDPVVIASALAFAGPTAASTAEMSAEVARCLAELSERNLLAARLHPEGAELVT